jgi:hypothetical protein
MYNLWDGKNAIYTNPYVQYRHSHIQCIQMLAFLIFYMSWTFMAPSHKCAVRKFGEYSQIKYDEHALGPQLWMSKHLGQHSLNSNNT